MEFGWYFAKLRRIRLGFVYFRNYLFQLRIGLELQCCDCILLKLFKNAAIIF